MNRIPHPCDDCIFAYFTITTSPNSLYVYDALFDGYRTISVNEENPACGETAGGITLDKEQPKCSKYKSE